MFHQVVVSLVLLTGMTFVYALGVGLTVTHEERPKLPQRDGSEEGVFKAMDY